MPEGPELHIAARLVNTCCKDVAFHGAVQKSEVNIKNPNVQFKPSKQGYSIEATARGKEMKLFLRDLQTEANSTSILFRFGMTGCFKFTSLEELPKHSHLRFFTKDKKNVLSFVDQRRFGKWEVGVDWGKDRGPDPMFEYEAFRGNVLNNLDKPVFEKPICEVMLNQQYFNGIGNYLRAEILFRCQVPPFDQAREVLEQVKIKEEKGIKRKPSMDFLFMCHLVPLEVLSLEHGTGYLDGDNPDAVDEFTNWLQCYYKPEMENLVDSNGRTVWFSGPPGKLAPKCAKSRGLKRKPKKLTKEEETD